MARQPAKPRAAEAAPTVTVLVGGVISDGRGGKYPQGAQISPTPEQIASLKRQGFVQ